MAQAQMPLSQGIGTLKECRTLAEHSAATIKRMKGKLSEGEYRQTQRLYTEGKAAVDGWVKQVLLDIEGGTRGPEMSESQKRTLETASLKVQTFLEFAGALSRGDMSRGWEDALAQAIPNAIDKVVEAGIKLWREFRSVGAARRENLSAEIRDVQWRPFDEIPAVSAIGAEGS